MTTDGPHGSGSTRPTGEGPGADPMIGQVLSDRYRIIDKLGEGGMGEVYAAEHIHIEKRLALKLLRREIVTNEEAVARFRQEAKSASSIGHENIIRIEDFGELPDGRIFLCMELLEGKPLNDLLQEGSLDPVRALDILIQTCHGLGAAHRKGVIHRDMKPENIFVTWSPGGQDVPKLLDFGIAKVSGADGNNHLTRTGTIFGTPFYMAPEQALGQAVDHRADVYALGVIMYEIFTGSIPFTGESFMGILTKHITAEPMPPSQMAAEHGKVVPPGVEEVILRTLRKDPDERFQSMEELIEVLVSVRRGLAGAGMSSFMPAQGGPGVAMPAAPSGVYPGAGFPSPTPPPQHPGAGFPSPTPPPQHPSAAPFPMASTIPRSMAPSDSAPYQASPGTYGSPSDSHAATPRKSRLGAVLVVFLILGVLGGGGAGLYVYLQKEGGGGGGPTEPATDPGKEPVKVPPEDPQDPEDPKPKDPDDPPDPQTDPDDPPPTDPDDPPEDPLPPPETTVLVVSQPAGADIILGGEKIGVTPDNVRIAEGEAIELVLKRRGYQDQSLTVDGKKDRLTVRLRREARPQPDPPEPAFCDRPENRNHVRCLPRDDCRRPENKNLAKCMLE